MSNIELLQECKLQLEYLNQKFTATGTTNSLLAKIEAALENKVSDISVHNFLEEKLCDHEDESGKFYRGDTVIHLLQEYASIVNENKDIDEECLKITGHNSPKEYAAYEKGREDEQEVIMKWIEEWNGSSNSVMGALLKKKFNELFTYLSKQTNNRRIYDKHRKRPSI